MFLISLIFVFFIFIAELKSLTRAAERMHLLLAAASDPVKKMESRFGVRLLYRENKGAQLSPAGKTLLVHTQQFMQQVERLKNPVLPACAAPSVLPASASGLLSARAPAAGILPAVLRRCRSGKRLRPALLGERHHRQYYGY